MSKIDNLINKGLGTKAGNTLFSLQMQEIEENLQLLLLPKEIEIHKNTINELKKMVDLQRLKAYPSKGVKGSEDEVVKFNLLLKEIKKYKHKILDIDSQIVKQQKLLSAIRYKQYMIMDYLENLEKYIVLFIDYSEENNLYKKPLTTLRLDLKENTLTKNLVSEPDVLKQMIERSNKVVTLDKQVFEDRLKENLNITMSDDEIKKSLFSIQQYYRVDTNFNKEDLDFYKNNFGSDLKTDSYINKIIDIYTNTIGVKVS